MKTTLIRGVCIAAGVMFLATAAQAAGMVTAKNGMTLYVFDNDKGGVPSCYDACAKNWPGYMGKTGDALTEGWTLVKRKDNTMQWAYDTKPVYFFAADKKKGDKNGDGLKGIWHVIVE